MRIAIGSDHGGFERKQQLISYIESLGHTVQDFGCFDTSSVDYPDYGIPVAKSVAQGQFDRGVVICTTGIGMCITANKIAGIRCALCSNTEGAELTRRHNDTNVLAIGAKFTDRQNAEQIVNIWLSTDFEGGRHARRVEKVNLLDQNR